MCGKYEGPFNYAMIYAGMKKVGTKLLFMPVCFPAQLEQKKMKVTTCLVSRNVVLPVSLWEQEQWWSQMISQALSAFLLQNQW